MRTPSPLAVRTGSPGLPAALLVAAVAAAATAHVSMAGAPDPL
ncbi:hypothetical protein AB0E04_25760 [Streptomyces sp. NPDC048251]